MSANIEESITTNKDTFITTTIGQGVSLGFYTASAGSFAVMKGLNDETLVAITDDAGDPIVITSVPFNRNFWVGAGTDIYITTTGISGTLLVTANPLKSDK